MAELAAILAKRRSITDASVEAEARQVREKKDSSDASASWRSADKTPEKKSKRLPPPPRRPSTSKKK